MGGLTALITGAASGLGKATAQKFLADGFKVVAFDKQPFNKTHLEEDEGQNEKQKNHRVQEYLDMVQRQKERKESLLDLEYENDFISEYKDKTDSTEKSVKAFETEAFFHGATEENCIMLIGNTLSTAAVNDAIKSAVDTWDKLDVVVNCAAVPSSLLTYNEVEQRCLEQSLFASIFNNNILGTFNVTRLAARALAKNTPDNQQQRGVIINTASSFSSDKGGAQYSASSGGIISMTLPISRELASLGIRVNCIAPGLFNTPFLGRTLPIDIQQFLGSLNAFPKRLGKANEFAHLVTNVVSNHMINGETIHFNAGNRQLPY